MKGLKKGIKWSVFSVFVVFFFYGIWLWATSSYKVISNDPLVWQSSIKKLTDIDDGFNTNSPSLLFVGSSSIRLFNDLDTIFKDDAIIRKGFGGAKVKDVDYYKEQLIFKYNPVAICIYLGANDILYRDTTIDIISSEYMALVDSILNRLPRIPVALIALRPTSNIDDDDMFGELNEMMSSYALTNDRVAFIDVNQFLLDELDLAKDDLLRFDGLHLNKRGYGVWGEAMKPRILSLIDYDDNLQLLTSKTTFNQFENNYP